MRPENWEKEFAEACSGEAQQGRPKPFPKAMRDFLSNPPPFRFRREPPVFLILDVIQPIQTDTDYQLLLQFRISRRQPPRNHHPKIGDAHASSHYEMVYKDEGEDRDEDVLWYTLTSLNSLEQNKKNLRSFVLRNRNSMDDDIPIAGDLTGRENRLIDPASE